MYMVEKSMWGDALKPVSIGLNRVFDSGRRWQLGSLLLGQLCCISCQSFLELYPKDIGFLFPGKNNAPLIDLVSMSPTPRAGLVMCLVPGCSSNHNFRNKVNEEKCE